MQKQLAVAKVISESDEKKTQWQEWGKNETAKARKEYEKEKLRISNAVDKGITQVDAHKMNLLIGIQNAEEAEQRDERDNVKKELNRLQEEKITALAMMQLGNVRGVRPKDKLEGEEKEQNQEKTKNQKELGKVIRVLRE